MNGVDEALEFYEAHEERLKRGSEEKESIIKFMTTNWPASIYHVIFKQFTGWI